MPTKESPNYILKQFLKRDGGKLPGNMRCKSVLLQIKKDLDYSLCHFDLPTSYQLSNSALNQLYKIRPMVAPILLFCTAVDLTSVIIYNRKDGDVGIYFKRVLAEFYKQSEETASLFWDIRNSLAHEYSHRNIMVSAIHPVLPKLMIAEGAVNDTGDSYTAIYSENLRNSLMYSLEKINNYILNQPSPNQEIILQRVKEKGLFSIGAGQELAIARVSNLYRTE